jgi:hypothetical protein
MNLARESFSVHYRLLNKGHPCDISLQRPKLTNNRLTILIDNKLFFQMMDIQPVIIVGRQVIDHWCCVRPPSKWWKGHYNMWTVYCRRYTYTEKHLFLRYRKYQNYYWHPRNKRGTLHIGGESFSAQMISNYPLWSVRCWSRNSAGCYGEIRDNPVSKIDMVLWKTDLRAHKYRWASESRPNNVDRIKKPNDT